jgi:8-oxo-dGTP pyrophosphatase MutT (NUDIX family)
VTLSIADVQLPDGVRFEQYVYRSPQSAMTVLVENDAVLMIRRHRFVIDQWLWELPGGYIEDGETPAQCAARECEEETGWRPRALAPLASFQPWVATADARQHVFASFGAEQVADGPADGNEAAEIAWIPLDEAHAMTRTSRSCWSAADTNWFWCARMPQRHQLQ